MAEKETKLSLDSIVSILDQDALIRAAVVRKLARDYPTDYLSQVSFERKTVEDVVARFIASNKEWQE